MITKQTSTYNTFVAGLLLGGVIATLLTPRSGKDIRKGITRRLASTKDTIDETAKNTVKLATEKIEDAKKASLKDSKMTDDMY